MSPLPQARTTDLRTEVVLDRDDLPAYVTAVFGKPHPVLTFMACRRLLVSEARHGLVEVTAVYDPL